jgi:CTP:molybdopterin cytidylyltransferase MocA
MPAGSGKTGDQRAVRVAAIVLAAGRSSRMGADNKLLADIGGKPMVRLVVEEALASKARPVLAVTGHQTADVAAALSGLDATLVANPDYATGLASSLKAGIRAVPSECAGAAILLGDMPRIDARHIDRLIEAFAAAPDAIIVPVHENRQGNPVLWPRRYFPALLQLDGDTGAKRLIAAHQEDVRAVEIATAGIFADIDTPEELAQMRVQQDHISATLGSLAVALLCMATPARATDAAFDALLARYVRAGSDGVNRVEYAAWKASARDLLRLKKYIDQLTARGPSKMARNEAFAYWANLYNAVTLKVVLDRYPVSSIRDIKSDGWLDPKAYLGPWRTKRVTVEGRSYSLDDIENEVLRPVFKDPRVHYAVNCASYGCPNLRAKAWSAATLDADLDLAARAFINHPRAVTLLPNSTLRVSSIYRWFAADFGGGDAAVIAHLRRYAEGKLANALASNPTIAEDGYDWSLNDVRSNAKLH